MFPTTSSVMSSTIFFISSTTPFQKVLRYTEETSRNFLPSNITLFCPRDAAGVFVWQKISSFKLAKVFLSFAKSQKCPKGASINNDKSILRIFNPLPFVKSLDMLFFSRFLSFHDWTRAAGRVNSNLIFCWFKPLLRSGKGSVSLIWTYFLQAPPQKLFLTFTIL